ncbi:MAG: hypothetical protein V3R91_05555 [Myxococcota bacterium]|jgi:hypothetical protein
MTQNPYEPPKSRLADAFSRRNNQPGEFDIAECLADAWSLTWASFPTWLAVGTIGSILLLISTILFVPLFIVVPVLAWGGALYYLNVIDDRERFGDLFAGFSTYVSALLAIGGWYLGTLLIGFIGQGLQMIASLSGSDWMTGLGVIANLVWTVAIVSRLYFGPFFIVDQGMGPIEALQASWDATQAQKLRTAGLFVISSLVGLSGLLALFVGVVFTMNMFFLMWASGYRQMVQMVSGPAGTPVRAFEVEPRAINTS